VAAAAFIALWQGIAAHGGLLNVPWFGFLQTPKLVGGFRAIFVNACVMGVWTIATMLTSLALGLLTEEARPLVAVGAQLAGVQVANTPGASVFLLCATWAFYLTVGTAHTCQQLAKSPPKELLEPRQGLTESSAGNAPNPQMTPWLAIMYWRTQGPAKLCMFLMTVIMVPFYRYFLDRRGILENGAARLLLNKFGQAEIIEYCKHHCDLNKDESELSSLLGDTARRSGDHLRAYAIATVLVRRHGYGGAESRLIQFKVRSGRSVDRFNVEREAQIALGSSWPCVVANASNDGSGVCVRLHKDDDNWGVIGEHLKPGVALTMTCGARSFELTVARVLVKGRELILGLRAPNVPEHRRALLESLRAPNAA
jgi:hypothetical protein